MSSPRAGMVPSRVGIVGLGLVGGSVAKALAAAGTPAWGCDLDSSTERLALVETIAAGDHEGLVALLEEGTRMKREADAL